MEPQYTKRELDYFFKSLKEDVRNGFDGVHTRLDILNGKTQRNGEDINNLKVEGAVNKTKIAFFGAAGGIIVSLILKLLDV